MMKFLSFLILLLFLPAVTCGEEAPSFPYRDDPEILKILRELKPGEATFLPRPTAWGGGKNLGDDPQWPTYGPVHRDYSNRLVYMPDRKTAFYCGGGHAHRRYNDAWEYHLGSNTWVRLLPPDGGDQGETKAGWFVCGKLIRDPHAKLSDEERKNLEKIRAWFQEFMVVRNGYVQTRTTGAGFMTSHNWDGITYDPVVKQLLHAAGHCKEDDWKCYFLLLGEHTPDNFAEKLAEFEKTLTPPSSNMWVFDFDETKWLRPLQEGPFVSTEQGGSFFTYIPDLKKSIYYQAHGRDPQMLFFDSAANRWSAVKPNGGTPLRELIHKLKLAPLQEQQAAYSSKHRKLVAVIDYSTHVYDIDKNEWSRLPGERPLAAHDAHTIFDYDSSGDVFLLLKAGRKEGEGEFYGMSLTDGQWRKITPSGPFPFAEWTPGEGFYHPLHNVFVCHLANKVWVYRQ